MTKKLVFTFMGVCLSTLLAAQSITTKELQQIEASFEKNASDRALQNIITTNASLRANALNRELQGTTDHYFTYRVKVNGITNQQSSGRCWAFTSLNVLRPSVMEKYNLSDFRFSVNYVYFWDIFEKSNLFLENIIRTAKSPMDDRAVVEYFKNPIGDGGVWNLFYNIGEKYGVVPESVMPETAHSNNTAQLNSILNEKLRRDGYLLREAADKGKKEKELHAMKLETMKDVYRVLALTLGNPPKEIHWRYKTKTGEVKALDTTPMDFYKSIVPADYNPQNYIMVMNDPTREYYKVYEIDNYRNSVEGVNWIYLNLPNDEIKKAAIASIKNDEAMYTSSDVGKQFNRETGILDTNMYDYETLLGVRLDMDKKARILTRQSGSAHAMTLIGVDVDKDGNSLKWEFENSWGAGIGNHGYLTFTDAWFDEYMFRFVIHKKYLSEKAVKALSTKPMMLPMWDYMF